MHIKSKLENGETPEQKPMTDYLTWGNVGVTGCYSVHMNECLQKQVILKGKNCIFNCADGEQMTAEITVCLPV